MYYKIKGRSAPFSQVETIDIGMETLDEARQMLAEYRMAFGHAWGSLWIEDNRGSIVDCHTHLVWVGDRIVEADID